MKKKSKCYKKTKTKQKFFLFICCCLKKDLSLSLGVIELKKYLAKKKKTQVCM